MAIFALAFSPDARFFTTGSGDGWLHVYDVKVMLFIVSFFYLRAHVQFSRPRRNVTRGLLATSDLESSRLIGNSQGTQIEWQWLSNLTMSGSWMLHGYQACSEIVTIRVLGLDIGHLVVYCSCA